MATRRFSSLPRDYSRCYGQGCNARTECARYRQIEKDRKSDTPMRASYTWTLIDKHTGHCSMKLESQTEDYL